MAHTYGLPLELRADHLWALVLLGLGEHLRVSKKKQQFSKTQTLKVFRDKFVVGSMDNDWAGCFSSDIGEQVRSSIGMENYANCVPKFSTQTTVEKACYDTTAIGTLARKSHSFKKEEEELGISKVRIVGNLNDWLSLQNSVASLNEFGLEWWTP